MNRFDLSYSFDHNLLKQETPFTVPEHFGENRAEAEDYCQQAYQKQNQGALVEAIELYKKSIELYPTAEAHTFLGWAYSMQGRFEDAILECQKAIGTDPDYGNPYNDIGAYLIEQGKMEDAVPWLHKATEAKRYDAHFYPHYNLGRIWEKKGDWFKAFEFYSKALDLNPDFTLARQAIGRLQAFMN